MRKNIKGFTLLELIIVMAVMSVLATFTVITYQGSQATARDAQRRSDLKQYQTLLETHANNNGGFYPGRSTTTSASGQLCTDLGTSDCPPDIFEGQNRCETATCEYLYQSNGTCNNGTDCATQFVLYAALEKSSNFVVVCSSGVSGEIDNTTPPSGGVCPNFP